MTEEDGFPFIIVVRIDHPVHGPYNGLYMTPNARDEADAIEMATDQMTLHDYKKILSVRVIAVSDMKEVARW